MFCLVPVRHVSPPLGARRFTHSGMAASFIVKGAAQMAEAFFTQLAPADVRAGSAGTAPAAHVHPEVVEVMREVGIDQTLVLRKARECLRAEVCDPRAA